MGELRLPVFTLSMLTYIAHLSGSGISSKVNGSREEGSLYYNSSSDLNKIKFFNTVVEKC